MSDVEPVRWQCQLTQTDKELQVIEIVTMAFETFDLDDPAKGRVLGYLTSRFGDVAQSASSERLNHQ